jgi:hypothetical protein
MTCLYPSPAVPTAASVTPVMELQAMCSAHCASSTAQPAEQQAEYCLLSGTFQIMLHRAAGLTTQAEEALWWLLAQSWSLCWRPAKKTTRATHDLSTAPT